LNDAIIQRVSRRSPVFAGLTMDWAHGRCAWFALAAAKHFDLPLVGFFSDNGQLLAHVACATDSGLFDAYGFGTPDQVNASFRELGSRESFTHAPVTVDQVRVSFDLMEVEHDQEIDDALHVVKRLMLELGIEHLQAPAASATSASPARRARP
jgi:hypothetical protein